MKLRIQSLLIAILTSISCARDFIPPIGIPDPSAYFGNFDPIRTDPPNTNTYCPGWKETPPRVNNRAIGDVRDAYYIDKYHPLATDSGNPFGSPLLPRMTLPAISFIAGDYVEIHGDGYSTTSNPYTHPMRIRGNGTDQDPIWIVGIQSPVMTSKLDLGYYNSSAYSYLVFEGIFWRGANCDIRPRNDNNSITNIVIRNCGFKGNAATTDAAGMAIGASVTAPLSRTVTNLVIFNTEIYNYGDINQPGEEMGINLAYQVHKLWVLDSRIHDVAEDGIQLGHGAMRTSNAIYIGRCEIYKNLTNALDFKGIGSPVIVSQCRFWGHKDVWIEGVHKSTGMGQTVTFHYAGSSTGPGSYLNHPEDVSFIFNQVEGSRISIRTSSCGRLRIIGNIFAKTRRLPSEYTDKPKAIEIGGVKGETWICHNTFHDCEGGIQISDDPSIYSPNTLYYRSATVSYNSKTMVCINDNSNSGITGIEPNNMVYWKEVRLHIFGNIIANTFNNEKDIEFSGINYFINSTDSGRNCIYRNTGLILKNYTLNPSDITSNPQFIDSDNGNFQLKSTSPCIDAADDAGLGAYDDFLQMTEIEIRRDFKGAKRPNGASWDIGAHEFESKPPATPKGVVVEFPEKK